MCRGERAQFVILTETADSEAAGGPSFAQIPKLVLSGSHFASYEEKGIIYVDKYAYFAVGWRCRAQDQRFVSYCGACLLTENNNSSEEFWIVVSIYNIFMFITPGLLKFIRINSVSRKNKSVLPFTTICNKQLKL